MGSIETARILTTSVDVSEISENLVQEINYTKDLNSCVLIFI